MNRNAERLRKSSFYHSHSPSRHWVSSRNSNRIPPQIYLPSTLTFHVAKDETLPTMNATLFKDKVYLVTGGATGIGFACVQHLLSYGAYVYAVDLLDNMSKELESIQTDRLTYLKNDVSDRRRCHEVVEDLMARYGRFDGLVNNAGVTLLEGELPGDDMYDAITGCNLRGVWNMSTEALVHMRNQKSGSIVNIGSISAVAGKARLAVYAASKHAVLGLTRSWALDYAKYGVRINMIGPGKSPLPK